MNLLLTSVLEGERLESLTELFGLESGFFSSGFH
jgi:hypothetical protein